MPHDLKILCDTIDMWSFQFRYWSTMVHYYTPDDSTSSTLLQKMLAIRVQLCGATLVGQLMIGKKFFDVI